MLAAGLRPARRPPYAAAMASRRWFDAAIAGRILGGLALMAIPTAMYFGTESMSRAAWTLGIGGLFLFVWGLSCIGDKKNDWES